MLGWGELYTLRKKWYKSCHWGSILSKDNNMYHLDMYPLSVNKVQYCMFSKGTVRVIASVPFFSENVGRKHLLRK